MNILKNKKCLVTGGTRGIGKEIVEALRKEKCKVFAGGRKDGDLSTSEGVYKLINNTYKVLGNIDILINCAGIYATKKIINCSLSDYHNMFNINVLAPWMLCREVSHRMIAQKWGRIVNIGSISAYQGFPDSSLYCGSKHALLGITRALRGELKEHNIRVYCISPSGSKTDMGKQIENEKYDTFLNPKEIAEYVTFVLKFDNELISEEIRLNRFKVN